MNMLDQLPFRRGGTRSAARGRNLRSFGRRLKPVAISATVVHRRAFGFSLEFIKTFEASTDFVAVHSVNAVTPIAENSLPSTLSNKQALAFNMHLMVKLKPRLNHSDTVASRRPSPACSGE